MVGSLGEWPLGRQYGVWLLAAVIPLNSLLLQLDYKYSDFWIQRRSVRLPELGQCRLIRKEYEPDLCRRSLIVWCQKRLQFCYAGFIPPLKIVLWILTKYGHEPEPWPDHDKVRGQEVTSNYSSIPSACLLPILTGNSRYSRLLCHDSCIII
jgi:hypothetical protein